MRAGTLGHRLDYEAVDMGVGLDLGDAQQHRRGGAGDRRAVLQIQRDGADIGFVDDVGRENFQRDGKAERDRGAMRFLRRLGDAQFDGRDRVGLQNCVRFDRGQPRTPLGERGVHGFARGFDIALSRSGLRGRDLHQQLLRLVATYEMHHCCDGVLGRCEDGQARGVEMLAPLGGSGIAEP